MTHATRAAALLLAVGLAAAEPARAAEPTPQQLRIGLIPEMNIFRQKARFKLQARDWRGKPVRTELSVAVTDASLGYIQKDYAPDIRSYFYGDRRSQSVQQNNSIQNYLHPHFEGPSRVSPSTQHNATQGAQHMDVAG